ncbi:ribokinase [uncultured Anaerovibrio sp.]|uniref:ribokinase n=1 Tax=uncultured Anaerovibrio sp. TaxID=361586 RepID=UPI0025E48BF7|nr:ribokinase [uncultured Anaerovibrio sp.]
MKIAVIGSTNMDLVSYTDTIPAAGETREATGFHTACGGKGANQAIAAGKLGANVMMVTVIGDDLFGEKSMDNFMENNINTEYVWTATGVASGVATILVDSTSQNRILIHKGANACLTPEVIDEAADALRECGLIVLQLEIPLETVYAAIDFGVANGIPVLLNPAPATKELSMEKACLCDFFVPNETELAILTGMPTGTEDEIKKAAMSLVNRGLKNVIVTMGSKGSMWVSKNDFLVIPAKTVDAVDTTGAGDSFIGCFVENYSRTRSIPEAMKEASLYASFSVTRKGTQDSYLTKDEFDKLKK